MDSSDKKHKEDQHTSKNNSEEYNYNSSATTSEEDGKKETTTTNIYFGGVPTLIFLVILWLFLGFIAKLVSLFCSVKRRFNKSSVKGLFIAALAGPFYFLYLLMADDEDKC